MDAARPWASAVAINGGQILAVGGKELLDLSTGRTKKIDLEGRFVLPGLSDAHIHFYDWSLSLGQISLAECRSKNDLIGKVRDRANLEGRGWWLIGRGWNENSWENAELPTRADLDGVTGPDQPVLLWRSDMHCAVVNSAALELAQIGSETEDPTSGRIGRNEGGVPNGLLWELAVNLVSQIIPVPSEKELDERLIQGMKELNRLGITAVHDQRMKDQSEGPSAFSAYQRILQKGRSTLRINSNIAAHDLPLVKSLGLRSGFGSDFLRIGHLKLFADGTMGSKTAWMLTPFSGLAGGHESDYGIVLTPPDQMAVEMQMAKEIGIPTSVHAIGDRANRVVLDIFEELSTQSGLPSAPHRVEHVQIIDPQDLPRLAKLGLTASVQPVHLLDDMESADHLLGERAERAYRFRSLAVSGALLALGSDAPVANPDPFLGIHAAVFRQRPDQMEKGAWFGRESLTLEQAIFGYTMAPAMAAGWSKIGSLTQGKRADMIVLDRNPFELRKEGILGSALADTVVQMTVFNGTIIDH